jgi:hypothetical protein
MHYDMPEGMEHHHDHLLQAWTPHDHEVVEVTITSTTIAWTFEEEEAMVFGWHVHEDGEWHYCEPGTS